MRDNKKGLTLIEIILSIVLIAIVAITALGFLVYCGRFAMRTGTRITASNFAREMMEDRYWNDYTTLVTGNVVDNLPGNRTRTYAVSNPVNGPNGGQYRVTSVTIHWN